MKDVTLITINWNQQKVMELLLKSFVKFHYKNEKLNLLLVDNGSDDNSKQWLIENNIPFISLNENIGHEQAINHIYPMIKTKYALIVDTDILFLKNVYDEYLPLFNEETKLIGEYLDSNPQLVPRVGAWFFFYDIEAMRNKNVNTFRDTENWSYDVGSWQTEKIIQNGFKIHKIPLVGGHQDRDIYGMVYDTHIHFVRVSWNLNNHGDRTDEVLKRRKFIIDKVNEYSDIDLKNKFI